jgi:hypothetical protein
LGQRQTYALNAVGLAFKMGVWIIIGVCALFLLLGLYKLTPLMLVPFFAQRELNTPRSDIAGNVSPEQARRRVAKLRDLTAPPQAVANSAKRLTVVGIQYNKLRDARLKGTHAEAGDPLADPFRLRLDLSSTNGDAIVAISDQAIDWSITPPKADAPRAILGVESAVFPEFSNAPKGVLAGFRTAGSTGRPLAKPLQPVRDEDDNIRKFCKSVADWADYFSVPKGDVDYVLVEDPTQIAFRQGYWTSDGSTKANLKAVTLSRVCGEFGGDGWR